MNLNNQQIGKGIQLFGGVIAVFKLVQYGYGVYATLSDASVRVYAVLIAFEGALYVGAGLFLVWLGGRIRKNAEKQQAAESSLKD